LVDLLSSKTSKNIFLNASVESRTEFVELFDEIALEKTGPIIHDIRTHFHGEPYARLDKQVYDEILHDIYNHVRTNNLDAL
jgi:hypothetical protein